MIPHSEKFGSTISADLVSQVSPGIRIARFIQSDCRLRDERRKRAAGISFNADRPPSTADSSVSERMKPRGLLQEISSPLLIFCNTKSLHREPR